MTTRLVSELRPHPDNARIYGDHADGDLVESVSAKGVLVALLIAYDNRIISGHRRWEAAKKAGLKEVPTTVYGSQDELDILEAVIECNRQRDKTGEQLGRESKALLDIEAERARRRMLATQNNYAARAAVENFPPQTSEDLARESEALLQMERERAQPRQETRTNGKARDIVGEKLGVSGKQAEKAATVVTVMDDLAAQGKKRESEQLRATLNNKSVHAAYNQAREAGYIAPSTVVKKPTPAPEFYTLDTWHKMGEAEHWSALNAPRNRNAKFNEQDGNNIEWALWSWNPVTGCLHNCSYCYARDIAERFYAQKFAPSFVPGRLGAPVNTPVPAEAATNIGYKNVFTCSMADLFGRWVPREWIEAVLQVVADNQQWNFLFLTKFPIRLAEFEFPANAWLGTTVDAQARVTNAEKAFSRVRGGVKWLSCEPLLEPLTFTSLDMFDWVVIGGASKSTQTPEFRPPRPWIEHLEAQARRAGCRVYEKTNLLERLKEYPGQDDAAPVDVPDAFKMAYLQRDVLTPADYAGEFGL